MLAQPYNATAIFEVSSFAPFALLNRVHTANAPMLPPKLSFVQQVHIKLKAEAAVMFVFYVLKQVYIYIYT